MTTHTGAAPTLTRDEYTGRSFLCGRGRRKGHRLTVRGRFGAAYLVAVDGAALAWVPGSWVRAVIDRRDKLACQSMSI